jgi:hypothetical protein
MKQKSSSQFLKQNSFPSKNFLYIYTATNHFIFSEFLSVVVQNFKCAKFTLFLITYGKHVVLPVKQLKTTKQMMLEPISVQKTNRETFTEASKKARANHHKRKSCHFICRRISY